MAEFHDSANPETK